MLKLEINTRCIDCDVCVIVCPEGAILRGALRPSVENWSCTLCGICRFLCPVEAIELQDIEEDSALEAK